MPHTTRRTRGSISMRIDRDASRGATLCHDTIGRSGGEPRQHGWPTEGLVGNGCRWEASRFLFPPSFTSVHYPVPRSLT